MIKVDGLLNLKNNYVYRLALIILFFIVSILNKDYLQNINIIFFQIFLLLLIIFQSQILISKIVSIYFLIIYILPFFIWDYLDSIKDTVKIYPLDSILVFISMFFLIEFIFIRSGLFDKLNKSKKYFFINNRIIIVYALNVLILVFLNLSLLPDIIFEHYPDIFKYTLYSKITEIPFVGQILKKCVFLSFISLVIMVYHKNKYNIIFFSLIYILFSILAFLKTSRSEFVLINIPFVLYFIKKRYYFTLPLLLLAPYLTFYLIKIRYFFDDNGLNIKTIQLLIYKMIFESKINIFDWEYVKSITKASYSSFYERISFSYEYLTIYFYKFQASTNKYLYNLDAIIPSIFSKNKTVRPYEPNETLLLNLRNIEDIKTTVSLGPIAESLYVLHLNYLFVPVVIGSIFLLFDYLLRFNKIIYLSFSIYIGYFFAKNAETYTFVSIDLIFFILIIYIFKFLILKKNINKLVI